MVLAYQTRLSKISYGEVAQFGRGRATGNRVTVKSGSRVRISSSPPQKQHSNECFFVLEKEIQRHKMPWATTLPNSSLHASLCEYTHSLRCWANLFFSATKMQSYATRRVAFFFSQQPCWHEFAGKRENQTCAAWQDCTWWQETCGAKRCSLQSNDLRLLLCQPLKATTEQYFFICSMNCFCST